MWGQKWGVAHSFWERVRTQSFLHLNKSTSGRPVCASFQWWREAAEAWRSSLWLVDDDDDDEDLPPALHFPLRHNEVVTFFIVQSHTVPVCVVQLITLIERSFSSSSPSSLSSSLSLTPTALVREGCHPLSLWLHGPQSSNNIHCSSRSWWWAELSECWPSIGGASEPFLLKLLHLSNLSTDCLLPP